ncbi:MAG TPA: caspase family protein, partial [Burkholderiaceae bacterium]
VIGNARYTHYGSLKNPTNDSRDVAAKLRTLGFEVIERSDMATRQIGSTLREFRSKLESATVGLVFYAGHGMQIKGENYLPAVDAEIFSEEEVPNQSLALRQVMDVLEAAKTRVNLVFLDACRDNPLAHTMRSSAAGLARVDAPSGTMILYATRPGSVARDGSGRNGLFTSQLLRQMNEGGDLPIETVFKRVLAGVKQGSNGQQEPWSEGSMEGDFCFGACASANATTSATIDSHLSAPLARPAQAATAAAKITPPLPGQLASLRPIALAAARVVPSPGAAADDTRKIQVGVPGIEPLLFTRAFSRSDTGRIYRLSGDQASEQYARLPEGNKGIFSVAQSPSGDVYFCDATESFVYQLKGGRESVVYQHAGFVKHLAFDPSGRLHFSSTMGPRSEGTIYRLDGNTATPVMTVKPDDLDGSWSGTFAFDRSGTLWLSSGSRTPGSLYRVRDNRPEKIFTAPQSGIMGFSFLADGSIAFADNRHSVMQLTLPDLHLTRIFESPYDGWLTDVKPALVAAKP